MISDRIRGYEAADRIIGRLLDAAQEKRPARAVNERSAAYRAGYFKGLLMAHCQMALGQFPDVPENAARIDEATK